MSGDQRIICRDPAVDHLQIRSADSGCFYFDAGKARWRDGDAGLHQMDPAWGFDTYGFHVKASCWLECCKELFEVLYLL